MIGNELKFSNRFTLPIAWMGEEVENYKNILYRLYTQYNELLYIGITTNLLRRMRSHRAKVFWWDDVDYLVAESCESLEMARYKEIKAITSENPEYNIQSSLQNFY